MVSVSAADAKAARHRSQLRETVEPVQLDAKIPTRRTAAANLRRLDKTSARFLAAEPRLWGDGGTKLLACIILAMPTVAARARCVGRPRRGSW
jgi:hypothetical protein